MERHEGTPLLTNESSTNFLVPNYASFYGESLLPPTDEGKRMTEEDFKKQYPVRYNIWTTLTHNLVGRLNEKSSTDNLYEINNVKVRLHILNKLDRYILNHPIQENGTKLKEEQMTIFKTMRDFLEQGGTEGYVKVPTGVGKTVLFSKFIEATDLKTLIVVPTQLLVNQTGDRLSQHAPEIDYGKIYADAKEHGRHVTVTSYDSLVRKLEDGTLKPEEYDLLILDEAHRGLSDKRQDAIRKFEKALKIGFTATPKFSENKQVSSLLNTEIYNMKIREAVREGLLSPFSAYIVKTDVDLSNVSISSTGEYNPNELDKAINTNSRNLAAVELYERAFSGQTSVAYCVSINHAENLAEEFKKRGINAAVISGKHTKKEQEKIQQQFKSGEIQVLCNADLLIEGFDEPKASVCLNLRPTLSGVIAEQRGGRVLRINPDNPSKHAYIVDFIDQGYTKGNPPITFAQIVGGPHVFPPGKNRTDIKEMDEQIKRASLIISGIQVIVDPTEVMKVTREMEALKQHRPEQPQEGWKTQQEIIDMLKVKPTNFKKFIEKYLPEHPESQKRAITEGGKKAGVYSPQLVRALTIEVARGLVSERMPRVKRSAETALEKIQREHPEIIDEFIIMLSDPQSYQAGKLRLTSFNKSQLAEFVERQFNRDRF